ncbi:hypothetical protein CVU75_01350 [Candidatus Dependentiae bacterium HGW-Dependentiae-1]|nr:MAG: hypothetical protein CVU75_01350 [Candidatus Dependentiae bacterium HGW-Dependentiae-1]
MNKIYITLALLSVGIITAKNNTHPTAPFIEITNKSKNYIQVSYAIPTGKKCPPAKNTPECLDMKAYNQSGTKHIAATGKESLIITMFHRFGGNHKTKSLTLHARNFGAPTFDAINTPIKVIINNTFKAPHVSVHVIKNYTAQDFQLNE